MRSTVSTVFSRILVADDGSEPADRALAFAIALGHAGSAIDIVNVADEISAMAESTTMTGIMDPTPVIDAIDEAGRAVLAGAAERCRAAGIAATTTMVRDRPVPGITAAAVAVHADLIVLGTHARSGLPRAFLGSTTEGVLRTSTIPVLAVTASMTPAQGAPFRKVLVAVDDSDPADAAVQLAARLSQTPEGSCVLCSAVDAQDLYEKAGAYGFDPTPIVEDLRTHARDVLERARDQGGFAPGTASTALVEDEPGRGIIVEAERVHADAIAIGSHGRRGLRRLFLGSVAEYVVRHSPIPVFVLRPAVARPSS